MLFKQLTRTLARKAARPAQLLALLVAAACVQSALADEAQIRKNLAERLKNLPPIDEVSKTGISGLYEVRIGTDIVYTDESGNYLIQGSLVDTRTRIDLTEDRINKLTAINFADLPLKDAIVWKNGNGARRLAVFVDPNCGYCRRFEAELQKVKDVTVYTFLMPILGGDSPQKSEAIWCAKEPAKAWLAWMLENKQPARNMGTSCDTSSIDRNVAYGRKHRLNGTPALIFADGTRKPGMVPADQLEQLLASAAAAPAAKP